MQNTRGDVTGEVQQHVGETDSKTKQSEDKKGRQTQKVSLEIKFAQKTLSAWLIYKNNMSQISHTRKALKYYDVKV